MSRITCFRLAIPALVVLASACGQPAPEDVETQSVVPVTTTAVVVGTIRGVIHATGVVTPAPGADLVVIAPEPARILEMPKAEGNRVRRGDLLVRFEIPAITADVAARAADVTRAHAQVKNAKAAETRRPISSIEAWPPGRKSKTRIVTSPTRRLALAAALAAQVRCRRSTASTHPKVHATFDGIVARRLHNPGDQVEAAGQRFPLLRVIDPRRLEVTALVPVSEVQAIEGRRLSRGRGRVRPGASRHEGDCPGRWSWTPGSEELYPCGSPSSTRPVTRRGCRSR